MSGLSIRYPRGSCGLGGMLRNKCHLCLRGTEHRQVHTNQYEHIYLPSSLFGAWNSREIDWWVWIHSSQREYEHSLRNVWREVGPLSSQTRAAHIIPVTNWQNDGGCNQPQCSPCYFFIYLFFHWMLPNETQPCAMERGVGLVCLSLRGMWEELRLLNETACSRMHWEGQAVTFSFQLLSSSFSTHVFLM